MNFAGLILSLAVAAALSGLFQPSNSQAATARGVAAYSAKNYGEAVEAFALVPKGKGGGVAALNKATAMLAAGSAAEGMKLLDEAIADPATAAPALYNRGTAHLNAKNYDQAIRDLAESLSNDPSNRAAKRNLEIATRRRQQQEQQESGGGGDQPQPQPQQQQGESPRPDEGDPLLRSIEQQEREELSRMRRAGPGQKRVGW